MITNISIDSICAAGHHAKISYQANAIAKILNNLDYDQFFNDDFSQSMELSDLRDLLNQHEHNDWLSLKNALEA